jgi:hypothetical protein
MSNEESKSVPIAAHVALIAALCAMLAGCGGDEPSAETAPRSGWTVAEDTSTSTAAASDAHAASGEPVVHSVHLSPARPRGGERIRAQVDARKPDGKRPELEFHWVVRGKDIRTSAPAIDLPELRRGDEIAVTVIAIDGEARSEPWTEVAKVRNTPPRVRDLRLRQRSVSGADEEWYAEAWGDDPDGDPVQLSYSWLVNDAPIGESGESFPTARLKRNDRLRVRVIADDGMDESMPAESGLVTIANSAPDIVSTPPGLNSVGRYVYQIEAEDADGDRGITYTLAEGPRGMEVDRSSGLVSWTPSTDQAGRHRVEVVVEDGRGGRTSQVFEIPIIAQYGTSPAAVR